MPSAERAVGIDLYELRSSIKLADAGAEQVEVEIKPTLNEAIQKYADGIVEQNKVTAETLERIFAVDASVFKQSQVDYYQAYVRIAVRELVRGAVDILKRSYKEEDIIHYLSNGYYIGYVFTNDLIFHDVMHTVMQVGSSKSTNPSDMRPLFQRAPLEHMNYGTPEYEKHKRAIHRDEMAALLWYRVTSGLSHQREETIQIIKNSKNEEEFVKNYFASYEYVWSTALDPEHATEIDPHFKSVLGRIYREYEKNPALLYTIFEETTMKFMQANDPEAAKLVAAAKKK